MRTIDADALMEILTTAIRNMKSIAKFIGTEDDPEIQMEIKAYTDIAEGVKGMPTIEPERKTGKWIRHPEWQTDGECGYECDQCGMGSDIDFNFCMRCGAKMHT